MRGLQLEIDIADFEVCPSGLQGSWNAFSEVKGIKIPHGDVIVFALAYGLHYCLHVIFD